MIKRHIGLISAKHALGLDVSETKRLKVLEAKNARLKKLLAESLLEQEITREVVRWMNYRGLSERRALKVARA